MKIKELRQAIKNIPEDWNLKIKREKHECVAVFNRCIYEHFCGIHYKPKQKLVVLLIHKGREEK